MAPDGSSTLVTRGVLNLSARHGRDQAVPWTPGTTRTWSFELNGIGHAFPPGHRIRLAVSSAYWPWIWPQPGSEAGLTLDPAGSALELPVRARRRRTPPISFEEPEQAEPLGVDFPATLDEPRPERLVVRDVAKGEWRLEVDPRYGGTRVYPDGLEFTEDALETYDDPGVGPPVAPGPARTGRSGCTGRSWRGTRASRPAPKSPATRRTSSPSNEVVCRDGDEVVFHRTWEKRIPRTAG